MQIQMFVKIVLILLSDDDDLALSEDEDKDAFIKEPSGERCFFGAAP